MESNQLAHFPSENLYQKVQYHKFNDILSTMVVSLNQEAFLRKSQVLLIREKGGMGKTFLLREIYKQWKEGLDKVIWFEPIDMDDPKYWLFTNVQHQVIHNIKNYRPNHSKLNKKAFRRYDNYVFNFAKQNANSITPETIVSYLRKDIDIFVKSYTNFLQDNKIIPIIIFDTVETIRKTQLQKELVLWMKRLPGTLFILAGRPAPKEQEDSIVGLLQDSLSLELPDAKPLLYQIMPLPKLTISSTRTYFKKCNISSLDDKYLEAITELSKGNILTLALTANYLSAKGMPSVVESWLNRSEQYPMSKSLWQENFTNQLLLPYFEEGSFWNQAVLRLAIIRRQVSFDMWVSLVNDLDLPSNVNDFDEAWRYFLGLPWVRERADKKYITLHDALAEMLAKVLPLHDPDGQWRMKLWIKAIDVCQEAISKLERSLVEEKAHFEDLKLRLPGNLLRQRINIFHSEPYAQQEILDSAVGLDNQPTELLLLKTTCLHYKLLVDHKQGFNYFTKLFDEIIDKGRRYDFGELIWATMQHFLPDDPAFSSVLKDVEQARIKVFQQEYQQSAQLRFDIGSRGGALLSVIRPEDAEVLLTKLLEDKEITCKSCWCYRLLVSRGKAYSRIKDKLQVARGDFEQALKITQANNAPNHIYQLQGFALSELANYNLSFGSWHEASKLLEEANLFYEKLNFEELSEKLKCSFYKELNPKELTEEFECSYITVITQRGHTEALKGNMGLALKLASEAVQKRKERFQLKQTGKTKLRLAMAKTSIGEVYRLNREYIKASTELSEAENLVRDLHRNDQLGEIYHKLAYCLFKAQREEQSITSPRSPENLIQLSLEYCRNSNIRQYPVAHLRAGQILGENGLWHLKKAIALAKEIGDLRTLALSLITHEELVVHDFLERSNYDDFQSILKFDKEIEQVLEKSEFIDLKGRWHLLKGHLEVLNSLSGKSEGNDLINNAIEHYKKGFDSLQKGVAGSFGEKGGPDGYELFLALMKKLSQQEKSSFRVLSQALRKYWEVQKTNKLINLLEPLV